MKKPVIPNDESARLDALRALNVLDTSPEERFDRLTRMAKRLFGVPISLVSLVDENRQWFKSRQGLDVDETPREVSFCAHAINKNDILVIPDTAVDERFHDNPLVLGKPFIRFYAGCPLKVAQGSKIGTLCIIDVSPRDLDDEDKALLLDLARMAEQELAAVQLATMDELTLLSNRRGFQSLSQHSLSLALRTGRLPALLYIDLDGFKPINDRFGHAEGDRVLSKFASILAGSIRDADVAGRIGGDEFAVLLSVKSPEDVDRMVDRLRESVDRENREAKRGYEIAYSVGLVMYDERKHHSVHDLIHEADQRMYEHKRRDGRDTGNRGEDSSGDD